MWTPFLTQMDQHLRTAGPTQLARAISTRKTIISGDSAIYRGVFHKGRGNLQIKEGVRVTEIWFDVPTNNDPKSKTNGHVASAMWEAYNLNSDYITHCLNGEWFARDYNTRTRFGIKWCGEVDSGDVEDGINWMLQFHQYCFT